MENTSFRMQLDRGSDFTIINEKTSEQIGKMMLFKRNIVWYYVKKIIYHEQMRL